MKELDSKQSNHPDPNHKEAHDPDHGWPKFLPSDVQPFLPFYPKNTCQNSTNFDLTFKRKTQSKD